jgi:uridine kinase
MILKEMQESNKRIQEMQETNKKMQSFEDLKSIDSSSNILKSPSLTHLGEIGELPSLDITEENGELKFGKPFVIGVCGGNCAGKLGVVNKFVETLGDDFITVLFQENFYKDPPVDQEGQNISNYNFDDPGATDWDLMKRGLESLTVRKPFETPLYDIRSNRRKTETTILKPKPIIIVEGLLILHFEEIRAKLDLKIYLDTDDDVRLSRRVIKDVYGKGLKLESVIDRYAKFVKPAHEKYVLSSKKHADIIIPNFGRELTDELVFITQKLGKSGHEEVKIDIQNKEEFRKLNREEFKKVNERFEDCNNMAISLIIQYIQNKLVIRKKPIVAEKI